MLAHLVCIDRRYQRMNCFNIRELQSMLKKRFFDDLILSQDYHLLLNNSMINLRFKLNTTSTLLPDSLQFHKFGITSTLKQKSTIFESITTPHTFYTQLPTPYYISLLWNRFEMQLFNLGSSLKS